METAQRTLTSAVCRNADTTVAQGLELSWEENICVRPLRPFSFVEATALPCVGYLSSWRGRGSTAPRNRARGRRSSTRTW